ncbi:exosortase V [Sphingomonas endolithica]|uniref:exosortase V n=1 Tax=Sphingomonas endolithica TaxID=2972485 RepID=UPI0021AFE2F6|nr:exosortase V [Sphingomonas sp. ZFBP2030]
MATSAITTGNSTSGAIAPLVLLAGLALVIVPTMAFVARVSWSTESGAHGPIVLFTGLWLLWRLWPEARPLVAPPPAGLAAIVLLVTLPLYLLARIAQIVEIQGYLMYAVALATTYAVIGLPAMRRLWFPLLYLAFMFPLPDTLVAALTGSLKTTISHAAVSFLYQFGYPIGSAGVSIQVGQFQLLVAAACSGLNSIVALTAISLFYVYIRHQADWRYALLLTLLILPVAIFTNFIRVLILILLTYHAGDATAQGFLHNFAGLTMFTIALLTIFALDSVIEPIWRRITARSTA